MPDNENDTNWSYNPKETLEASADKPRKNKEKPISWTASEFIDRHKGAGWYFAFFGGLTAISAVVYLITRDYISTGTIVIAGVIFVMLARRKPKQIPYEINSDGVGVGEKFYPYASFRSFGIAQEGVVRSINFMPLKRLMPEVTIYFPPEQEQAIVDIIANHLPHDEHIEKTIDKLAKRLNF